MTVYHVAGLTKAQLVDIFSGKVTNWKDLGGDNQEIVVINRAKGSGTRKNMANFLFSGDDATFVTGASEEDNSETVLQTVSQTPGAISYLGFAYLGKSEIVAFAIDNVKPTREDIQNGSWPVAAPVCSPSGSPPWGGSSAAKRTPFCSRARRAATSASSPATCC